MIDGKKTYPYSQIAVHRDVVAPLKRECRRHRKKMSAVASEAVASATKKLSRTKIKMSIRF